ncbi:MAG: hypothetical protein Q8R00_00445 [Candidatus Nanoarchaeia archaeon]|nr:hypothetical protein [Candidatus Nanoarchaeia archaeon]
MIELGGNIKLIGFSQLEPGMLVVVKKLVGNYARKLSDNQINIKELSLNMKSNDPKKVELEGKLITDSSEFTSMAAESNLFFAMDKALSSLATKIQK